MASLLIVDDDHGGRVALCEFLSGKGHQVTGVPNGHHGLASCLARRNPDVVILDLLVPGGDGAKLLRVIRSELGWQSLPVILLTGFPDGSLVDRARALNVDAVLTKRTATFADIHAAVEAALSRTPGRRAVRPAAPVNLSGAA